ncbi:MAG: thioredoxin [Clostridiales bacterium]|nr:thioredoxin [Clostridiales bacterium]
MCKIPDVASNFDEFIAKGIVVVDFWATWCGPCVLMEPVMEEVAENLPDVKFGKVDVDKARDLAKKFQIMSIPNICIFKDGELVDRIVGLCDEDELSDAIKKQR